MPYVPDDLLRKLIAHALFEDYRLDPDEGWFTDILDLLPENRPDSTYALRQYADDPVPSALFIRDGVDWTKKLTRTD